MQNFFYPKSNFTNNINTDINTEIIVDYSIKVIFVGDKNVGKTSLILKFSDDKFFSSPVSTIGVDFKAKIIKIGEKNIKIQIWDTAGQERFRTIVQSYYRGSNIIILVFDLTNRESFDNLHSWNKEINYYSNSKSIKILLGNKFDIETKRVVSYKEAWNFAKSFGFANYYESNAIYDKLITDILLNAFEHWINTFYFINNTNEINNEKKKENFELIKLLNVNNDTYHCWK